MALPDIDVETIHVTSTGYRHPLEDAYAPISDLQSTQVAAEFVIEGVALMADPDQMLPQPANPDACNVARKAAAIAQSDGARALAAWLREHGNTTTYTDPETLGRLAGCLRSHHVRDAVLVSLFAGPAATAYAIAIDQAPDDAVRMAIDSVLRPGGKCPGPDLANWLDLLAAVISHTSATAVGAPAWTLWALAQW